MSVDQKAYDRQRMAGLRVRWRTMGACVGCGRPRVDTSFDACLKCRLAASARARRSYYRRKAAAC